MPLKKFFGGLKVGNIRNYPLLTTLTMEGDGAPGSVRVGSLPRLSPNDARYKKLYDRQKSAMKTFNSPSHTHKLLTMIMKKKN